MSHYVRVYVPSTWFLGYQTSPTRWGTRWNVVLDLAVIPPFVLRIDFGLIAHRLFDNCYQCRKH